MSDFAHPFVPEQLDYRPIFFRNDLVNQPDQPVVGVDLFCAWAYAKWAGLQLPSEAQWEKAARGVDGRRYPWGDEGPLLQDGRYRANYNQAGHIGGDDLDGYLESSPVDAYTDGASPYGVLGMGGNVWEWTRSYYDPQFYTRMPSEDPVGPRLTELVAIRGGSWRWPLTDSRCANRARTTAVDRKKDLGFRCVLEP